MHIHDFNTAVCALVLLVALYVIVFRPNDNRAREWAFGVVGAILTYALMT